MPEFETLGYVLSPAEVPLIKVALLEESIGEIGIGDLVAVPIVLEGKEMYILGNVLKIEAIRPLLSVDSKAPFSLARGDTMNLIEDVDMLSLADLEDLAYIAHVYVHTFYYDGKIYTPNVVIPGSKLVKPPEKLLERLFSGEIEVGTVRGSDAKIYLSAEAIKQDTLLITGPKDIALELAIKIARGLDPSRIFYAGSSGSVDRPVATSASVGTGERLITSSEIFKGILDEMRGKDVMIIEYEVALSSIDMLSRILSAARTSPATFIILNTTYKTRPIITFTNSIIIGPFPIMKRPDSKQSSNARRLSMLSGIGENEFLLMGGTKFGIPVVGVLRGGAAGI